MRRRRRDLHAADRDDTDLDQPRPRAQSQNLAGQLGDRRLLTNPKARNRRMIRRLIGGEPCSPHSRSSVMWISVRPANLVGSSVAPRIGREAAIAPENALRHAR
jgi:hypothetical protein